MQDAGIIQEITLGDFCDDDLSNSRPKYWDIDEKDGEEE